MAREKYSDELRARVRARLDAGSTVMDAANAEGLPGPLVRGWATAWGLHVRKARPVVDEPLEAEPRPKGCRELTAQEVDQARALLRQGLPVRDVVRQLREGRQLTRALGWTELNPGWIWRP